MTKGQLTFVDTVGVQDYIFRTNDLKQIVGASFLVEAVTHNWLVEALPIKNNIRDINDSHQQFNDKTIEDDGLEAEVFLAGGGNATIAFASTQLAWDFAYRLTQRVLENASGLFIAVAHIPFDIRKDTLGGNDGALAKLARETDYAKMNLPRALPQLGVGVTLQCDFTHLPAVKMLEGQPVSAEVAAKLEASGFANQRLQKLLESIPANEWEKAGLSPKRDFPRQLDELGSTEGEKSVLAVIHTDGNGMGKRFRDISDRYADAAQNRQLLNEQRALSFSIQSRAETALIQTMRYLVSKIAPNEEGTPHLYDQIPLKTRKLPLRPILYGGDDVTFLADGRIGLYLAEQYLRAVSEKPLHDGKKLYSRAGIAIVKAHYPFARAYHLSEQLTDSCKHLIEELKSELEQKGNWNTATDGINAIDWQIAMGGQVRTLQEIRSTEYHINQGKLTMRPVSVETITNAPANYQWRSWDCFLDILVGFNSWQDSRNKLKALRAVLVQNEDAVKNFLTLNDLELPAVHGLPASTRKTGWHDHTCVYFDAVEMIDLLAVE